jgi:protein phosphatase 2C family protein 2/3
VYDGHGGSGCADFLRDNLHLFIIKEPIFPHNPTEALIKGFEAAEKKFMELCQADDQLTDRSGSCALVVLIVNDACYIANVGDSRAVLSMYSSSLISIETVEEHNQ